MMGSVHSDGSLNAVINEDSLDEHTISLRSLLKEKLKKKYLDTTCSNYVPMKLHLLKETDGEIKTEHQFKGLNGLIKDFLKAENVIEYDDLFKPCATTCKDVRTVLLKGKPGIGKTTAVKKFVLDWTEGRTHQDITFVLPFNLTELSLVTPKWSLMQLLGLFFPELTDTNALQHAKVLFVLDDLSKSGLKLKFWKTKPCGDPTKKLSLSALLVNLLRGNLLPKAQIWIMSSSEEVGFIPYTFLQRVVEIQGLDDVQWEEYIRRLVHDCNVATRAIIHIKSSFNLCFMSSHPVFCQIAATVLEQLMNTCNMELPLTLTEMYTHYLKGQAFQEIAEAKQVTTDAEEILKLGKLAWHTLEKGSLTVFKEDLRETKMALSAAAELSQRWRTLFKDEELIQGKAYSFAHHSIQAYLSALYVFVNYEPSKGNVLKYTLKERVQPLEAKHNMYQRAIDKALRSKEGQHDFFLIFLLGISAGPSYKDLSCFLPDSCQRGSSENIVPCILKNIKKSCVLILCLDELDVSYADCQNNVQEDLTPSEWSAKVKTWLNSEDQERIFDNSEYLNPNVAVLRLLPVIKNSKVLRLCDCAGLSWELLVSALRSPSNSITEIDIKERCRCVKRIGLLSEGLKSPYCKVEVLKAPHAGYSDQNSLISALLSNSSHLRELHLKRWFYVTDTSVEDLAKILVHPESHLEKLSLQENRLSATSFKTLGTALCSGTCHLKELDLSDCYGYDDNNVLHLSKGLGDPCCQIRVLRLASCSVGPKGFLALVSALSSNPSHLRELDLSYSKPGFHAFRLLCSLLEDPCFKLEKLILVNTDWWVDTTVSNTTTVRRTRADLVSDADKALAAALSSSHLRELDLSINDLEDSSVEQLSGGLGQPACKLEILRMARCKITEVGASTLANTLRQNPSHMRELDLSYNPVEGAGFDQLSSLVEDPAIKLEKIIVKGLGERHDIEKLRQEDFPLTLDPNTSSVDVKVSEGDKEAWPFYNQMQFLPENPERFKPISQVMCREGLTGRHFCQVEWFGRFATIGMTYKNTSKQGCEAAYIPGCNKNSWAITVSTPFPRLEALHDGLKTRLPDNSPWRVGVYLDWPAGTLSFYCITNDKADLLHTFYAKFTKPLYMVFSMSAGIRLLSSNPGPVCWHDHDPWDMFRGMKDCKGCNGSKAC